MGVKGQGWGAGAAKTFTGSQALGERRVSEHIMVTVCISSVYLELKSCFFWLHTFIVLFYSRVIQRLVAKV